MLMAQQPPLSTTFSVETQRRQSADAGQRVHRHCRRRRSNTFAVDPNFRVGFAQNWQASVQRDLPASLTVVGTYLGTQGQPPDAGVPAQHLSGRRGQSVPDVPVGFVYLTSNGKSTRHAGQVQLRRRLRNGLTAHGPVHAGQGRRRRRRRSSARQPARGQAIAQDWRDLDAEWAPSNFDQRHPSRRSFSTRPASASAGGTLRRRRARHAAQGLDDDQPAHDRQRPAADADRIYVPVPGTGVDRHASAAQPDRRVRRDAPDGYYVEPGGLHARRRRGTWGNAGRNSISGPSQFV